MDGTVPSTKFFLDSTVPSTNFLLDGTVPSTNFLQDGSVPFTNHCLNIKRGGAWKNYTEISDKYAPQIINLITKYSIENLAQT